MGEQNRVSKQSNKIVPLQMNAKFFSERALKSLHKNNYDKALRYFRRAVEYEPDNPINYCNLAGVLSEIGYFKESNEVLQTVIEEIAPGMHECYYYMANNSANMGELEESEAYILRYLNEAPEGEFVEEAEELLDYICQELQRPPRMPESPFGFRLFSDHDKARRMLEEGRFVEASQVLERIVREFPDFLPAQNNLSLAYYYTGQFEKALETSLQVLKKDAFNIHALCNLAVFYSNHGERRKVREIVKRLQNVVPLHFDQIYKLATTMGILGEHATAYRLFCKLLKASLFHDVHLCHYAAVAAFNAGNLAAAKKWWEKVLQEEPDSLVASFYLRYVQRVENGSEEKRDVPYYYFLPLEEDHLKGRNGIFSDDMRKNPLIRSSFLWALRHGDPDTKLQVIQAFAFLADREAEEALRQFLLHPTAEDYLKHAAIFVLKRIGAKEPYHAVLAGKAVTFDAKNLPRHLPAWLEKWQAVANAIQFQMKDRYGFPEQQEAFTLWMEFISKAFPDVPQIRKVEGWAAAVEYIIAGKYGYPANQQEIAARYGVGPATLSKNARIIREVCEEEV